MKKKVLSTVLCAAMVMGLAAGCGNSADSGTTASGGGEASSSSDGQSTQGTENAGTQTSSAGDKVTIRLSYWNSEDTMQAMLDYLAEAVPEVQIEYQFIDNSNYDTIIDTQLSAGEGPDIICESAGSALKHARLGYLAEVNDLAASYSDAGTSIYNYDGNVYALPGISWFEGIYYNKAIFEESNIELPKTFDEYISVCKKFEELGITPLAAGLKSWEPLLKNSMAFVAAEYLSTDGGSSFGEKYRNGEITMDGTWNTYVEKWSEMITEGIYTTNMTGVDHDQALEQFATGNAAMFCSGPWDYDAIMGKNPELKLDMMPFYGTKESDGWLIGGPGCGFAVNESSPNKEAALKVLEAISTVKGQEALWQNNQGGSSYLSGAAFELPAAYASVSKTLAAGNVYCPWNEWGAAAGAHETYGTEMQNYLLGTQDLSTTLQNVDTAVEELLSK